MTDNTATASTSPAEVQASEDPITPTSESAPLIAGSGDPVQPQVGPYHGMPHFWRSVIGWLLFSLVWNILNTAVFATLYPQILKSIDTNYVSDFGTANMITTLISSFLLPPLGSLADQLKQVKRWMFACELVGIALCYIFLPMIYINSYSAQIALAQIIYTLTLFFLRIAVMDNNALLNCFPLPYRVTLSLVFNFVGFASALLSLLVCWLLTRDEQLISNEKLVFVWALLTTFIALFTYLCPSDSVPYSTKQPVKTVVYRSFARMGTTLLALKNDVEYRRVLWFLLSYLFFSTSGTVFTIYVVTFFIDIYNSDTNDSTIVNMYYLLSLVIGTCVGIGYRYLINAHEVITLLCQNVAFIICFSLLFMSVLLDWGKTASLMISLVVGLLYAWNASLARGLMAKLTPDDKKGEFFGFYSTFTYLGISVVSGVFVIMTNCNVGTEYLCPLLIGSGLPSFVFFVLLIKTPPPAKPINT